jgi:hypothetical protein
LDEFQCSLPGHGTACVLRTTERNRYHFFYLDPIRGKGSEVGTAPIVSIGLGRWNLSADGTRITIPDRRYAGRFEELKLSLDASRRSERTLQVKELGVLGWVAKLPYGEGWFVTDAYSDPYQLFEARSRTESLYYVDDRLNPYLLYKTYVNTYGVFSPDGKRLAFLGTDLTSNVWRFDR